MNTDFPMFDDDPIIFDDEDFPEFGNSYYGDMPEIKKLLIPDGAYLTLNFFEADFIKEGVEEVWIENDFFADVDLSIGLGLMKDLKRFKILNPESPFLLRMVCFTPMSMRDVMNRESRRWSLLKWKRNARKDRRNYAGVIRFSSIWKVMKVYAVKYCVPFLPPFQKKKSSYLKEWLGFVLALSSIAI